MDNLVLANIFFRKTRTMASVAGVALGVLLVVLTVGLVHGFLNEQGRRNSAVSAEVVFYPQGTFSIGISTTLSIPISHASEIEAIEGVRAAVPVGQLIRSGRLIDGVDAGAFAAVSEIRIIRGRASLAGDEAMIDIVESQGRGLDVGDRIDLLDRPFEIVGVYEPESLGRIKIPLATMQEYLNRPDLCSLVLVRAEDPAMQERVAARVKERFPKNDVQLTRDLPNLYAQGTPALRTFVNVVVTLAIIVSSLIILLAMYTTVTERTRQIGILKSLGASRFWIAGEIEKEALLISLIGVLSGFALSLGGKYLIQYLTNIPVELEAIWLFHALVLGLLSGGAGALYPALRAANQDPVQALSYE